MQFPKYQLTEMQEMIREIRNRQFLTETMVFTNGCFDILHAGHVQYLAEARALGDFLVVAINSDASVRRLKGPNRPLNHQDDRALVLRALKVVDYVLIFDEDTPYRLIWELEPLVLVKGGDWKPEEIVGADIVLKNGGIVKSLSFVAGHSTTAILEKARELS